MKTEEEKTAAIAECKTMEILKSVLQDIAPIISYSRPYPIEYDYEKLVERIDMATRTNEWNLITRANGLRSKVFDLVNGDANEYKPS